MKGKTSSNGMASGYMRLVKKSLRIQKLRLGSSIGTKKNWYVPQGIRANT